MALQSSMLPLGTQIPTFSLPDAVSGKAVSSASLAGAPCLIAVICNHCPYVVHLKRDLSAFARELRAQGIITVAVSSNDIERYPADAPARMKEDAETFGYEFAYLFDEDQRLAQSLQAMCTPEFYLFGADGQLAYRGRFDESTPGNGKPVTGSDLRRAVDALLSGAAPIDPQLPSIGCGVKWKPGNAPPYVNG